jgi:arginyl-tRNA synthetase
MHFVNDISSKIEQIFEEFGLPKELGQTQYSDRPDLSDVQCNGALKAANYLKRKPQDIAQEIKSKCDELDIFDDVTVDGPGFLNFKLSDQYLVEKLSDFSLEAQSNSRKKIIVDYGGPNVAKPLHVGHLRSAIIGEAIKRIGKEQGHDVIGDIHMGDWGTPMGMLLAELEDRHPEWPYFQKLFVEGVQTETPPFSAETLNSLYPEAAKHYKDDEIFADKARQATAELQDGHSGYRALWKHFITLSVGSIKSDFSLLDVDFDLWNGESDADPYIENMVEDLIDRGIAYMSQGAVIIDVAQEDDKRDIPPLMLRKSDGAATYATTDLATIFQRVQDFNPDKILYVVDQRQEQHFVQVFRAAAKAGFISEDKLEHVGFGTMNGNDGKPFKTRAGGVMRLSDLIDLAKSKALDETGFEQGDITDEIQTMIDAIAVASIKYGDLRNPRISDYIFDPNEFVKFEGNTGPYNQYQLVRAKAVLERVNSDRPHISPDSSLDQYERGLVFQILKYKEAETQAYDKRMPSNLCDYMHNLSRSFSSFYKHCPVANESDVDVRQKRITLTVYTEAILEKCMEILAIPKAQKMLRSADRTLSKNS